MTTNTSNAAGKYASVNGINLYYEIHGTGKPLICFTVALEPLICSPLFLPRSLSIIRSLASICMDTDAQPSLIALSVLSNG